MFKIDSKNIIFFHFAYYGILTSFSFPEQKTQLEIFLWKTTPLKWNSLYIPLFFLVFFTLIFIKEQSKESSLISSFYLIFIKEQSIKKYLRECSFMKYSLEKSYNCWILEEGCLLFLLHPYMILEKGISTLRITISHLTPIW